MSNLSLQALTDIDGFMAAAMVDVESGLCLASVGAGVDMELAAAGNTEVLRNKRKTMAALGINEPVDDILVSMEKQYHLIRPLAKNDALFVYLILDRTKANLAMARHELRKYESTLDFS